MPQKFFENRSVRLASTLLAVLSLLLPFLTTDPAEAQSLLGSPYSLDRQNVEAANHAYTYLRNPEDIEVFLRHGLLVPVAGNGNYKVDGARFPYARPEVKSFLERIGRRYRNACGEPLVTTSLVRPKSHQPRNASIHSVHPTGMAMDLRRSSNSGCRSWLETTLLSLEQQGVLEATRERWPAHYHVALFPEPYRQWVVAQNETDEPEPTPTVLAVMVERTAPLAEREGVGSAPRASARTRTYRVRSGDTLFRIAERHGTTVAALKSANRLRGTQVLRGQVLRIPGVGNGGDSESSSIQVAWSRDAAKDTAPSSSTPRKTYRVRRGETLSQIASRHGVSLASLKSANRLRSSQLQAGQVLRIPSRSTSTVSAPKAKSTTKSSLKKSSSRTRSHRVRRGETLSQIASHHGVSVSSLKSANRLRGSQVLAGQVLTIPAR